MSDCTVCLIPYTLKYRLSYTCAICKNSACIACYKKHVLSTTQEPHCIHCWRALTTDVLNSMFSKHFRKNDLRRHQIQLLMEQEKSLFSETIAQIEREDIQNEYLNAHEHHKQLLYRLSPRDTTPVDMILILEINEIRKKLSRLSELMKSMNIHNEQKSKEQRKQFIRKCPNCEDGHLSTAWKCIVCKINVCNHCLEIKSDEHICNEENVKSAKTIDQETKPCPSCGTRVERSEGCSQMWCTFCNNAFDWKTGLKVSGPIHNPHFHEFIKNNLNGNQDLQQWQNACENNADPSYWPYPSGLLLVNSIRQTLLIPMSQDHISFIFNVHRFIIERCVSVRNYVGYSPHSYEDLRKKRLRNLIDDAEWSRQLSSKETSREKKNRMKLLDELIISVCRDIFGSLINQPITELDNKLVKPLESARMYYNEQLKKICEENEQLIQHVTDKWIKKCV
jgi:hypothetical protein